MHEIWMSVLAILLAIPMIVKAATYTFDGVKVNQTDCECHNKKGGETFEGQFCGGSKYLKNVNHTRGCRAGLLYFCDHKHLYPQDINQCLDGAKCTVDDSNPGKAQCKLGPRGAMDCGCSSTSENGEFCGVRHSNHLKRKKGAGCRDDHIYKCTMGKEIAAFTKDCTENEECGGPPGKAKCIPLPEADECMCKNEKEGWYCGGDKKHVESKKNTGGCRLDSRYKCIAFGADNPAFAPDSETCAAGTACVDGMPGGAKCVKK